MFLFFIVSIYQLIEKPMNKFFEYQQLQFLEKYLKVFFPLMLMDLIMYFDVWCTVIEFYYLLLQKKNIFVWSNPKALLKALTSLVPTNCWSESVLDGFHQTTNFLKSSYSSAAQRKSFIFWEKLPETKTMVQHSCIETSNKLTDENL